MEITVQFVNLIQQKTIFVSRWLTGKMKTGRYEHNVVIIDFTSIPMYIFKLKIMEPT